VKTMIRPKFPAGKNLEVITAMVKHYVALVLRRAHPMIFALVYGQPVPCGFVVSKN